ncbi:NADP-dependent oxidoreductase [Microbacterium sp. NPDC055683]
MRFRTTRSPAASGSNGTPADDATAATVPTTMRRASSAGPGQPLRITTAPVPEATMDELLIRVVAAGANPVDAATREGRGVAPQIAAYPTAPGFDFSGVVVRAPYEAHPLAPGTEVYGMTAFPRVSGSFAEYVVAASHSVAAKPTRLSHVEAAAVPLAALTAWQLVVETARAHEGQRILIHAGAGGVGHLAVQLASYFGAHVTTTSSPRNAAWLRELGADVVVDRTTTRFEDVVPQVDVVLDLVGDGGDRTGSRSLGVLRRGGLLVTVPRGGWQGFSEAGADAGVRTTSFTVAPDGAALATLARLFDAGDLAVYVDQVHPLAQADAALDAVRDGHARGKVVVDVGAG